MLLIHKPKGMTSHDVVDAVRRKTGERKVGHAGTLDPLAEGLMIVLVGKEETKKAAKFSGLPKSYEAVVRFGEKRDTGDLEGEIIDQKPCKLSETDIQAALNNMVGTLSLPVPRYSAVKIDGVPLYKRMRQGEQVEPPVRDMTVFAAELCGPVITKDNITEARICFDVASGVYIRSLAEHLGELLNCPATLAGLLRTRIGPYHLHDAVTLDAL